MNYLQYLHETRSRQLGLIVAVYTAAELLNPNRAWMKGSHPPGCNCRVIYDQQFTLVRSGPFDAIIIIQFGRQLLSRVPPDSRAIITLLLRCG